MKTWTQSETTEWINATNAQLDATQGDREPAESTKVRRGPQIAFTTDKRGNPIAYYLLRGGGNWRWIRMGYDAAKIAVATGASDEIPYARNR